ncbi:phospholipid-transporting ATPase ABCA3-like [Ixodes scapularis]|uniref:phospholipid-transporting ATPase ABCA3-like n=1 Tax=Ixodes scapularis TaxID=6945 RepID=UPI001AD68A18|nr:phospholipid-transporting ATPase ABCA3-like [Ixodes scapularis]
MVVLFLLKMLTPFAYAVYNKVPVVNNVSFKAFRGQITALLGHNGAGKTTTIRMITGQLASTKGLVLIGGHNVKTQSQAAHEDMGICPQTDIHFKDMTVYEHLLFFSELKRVPSSEIEQQLCKLLSLLKMSQKRAVLARHLSGGYRRKLSIGIALVGNSKVVILDEPTAGMDPAARREIWDLLILEKANRTILLTTHAMEEADAIGDRIAIMANGVIQCCGTSFFLKKNLGAGYHMVIVKNPVCNVRTLLEVVAAFAPSAEMESNVGTELSLRISRFDQPFFKHLFSHLEDNKEKLGISSFGVSVTTLEEVFLRVGDYAVQAMRELRNMTEDGQLQNSAASQLIGILNSFMPASGSSDESGEKSPTNTGFRLFVQQTWALLTMNMLNSVRNVQLTVSQLLVPLAVLSFTLTWIDLLPKVYIPSARLLDINRIHWSTVPYSFRGNKSRSLIEAFKNQLDSYRVMALPVEDNMNGYLLDQTLGDSSDFMLNTLIAMDSMDEATAGRVVHLFFNNQMFHTPAIALMAYQRALLHETLANSSVKLEIINHPFPRVVEEKANKLLTMHRESFQIGHQAVFGTSFLVSSFAIFLVIDHVSGSRHLQRISGLNMAAYWIANLTWSMFIYLLSTAIVIATLIFSRVPGFADGKEQVVIFLVFFYYGCSALPLVAAASFIFHSHSSACVRIGTVNFAIGLSSLVLVALLEWQNEKHFMDLATSIDSVVTALAPMYGLGRAISTLYRNTHFNLVCNDASTQNVICEINPDRARYCCKDYCQGLKCINWQPDIFDWGSLHISWAILSFGVHAILGTLVLWMFEKNASYFVERLSISRIQTTSHSDQVETEVLEDDNVAEERCRIITTPIEELSAKDILVMRELCRSYGNTKAVNDLSLGIRRGECFGLLGINGAGKTTTFKMLTGTIKVTAGDAFVDGYSVVHKPREVSKRIGYCPQHDALPEFLTGREVLTLYARIRGIPESHIPLVCTALAKLFYFHMHLDKTLRTYSMEECEAMCSSLVIMVNGRFCCLGSPQHLKNKFGSGYSIMIKVSGARMSCTSATSMSSLSSEESIGTEVLGIKAYMEVGTSLRKMRFILADFTSWIPTFLALWARLPNIDLIGVHDGLLEYHLPATSMTWAEIFDIMDQVKSVFNVVDYSVAQLTLEQVFLHFAMLQRETQT